MNMNVIPGHDDSPFVSFMCSAAKKLIALEGLEVNVGAHCPVMPKGSRYSIILGHELGHISLRFVYHGGASLVAWRFTPSLRMFE